MQVPPSQSGSSLNQRQLWDLGETVSIAARGIAATKQTFLKVGLEASLKPESLCRDGGSRRKAALVTSLCFFLCMMGVSR